MNGQRSIIVLLQQQGIVFLKLTDMRERRDISTPCRLQVIVIDVFMSRHIGTLLIEVEKGVDKVGLVFLEHIGSHVPLLHHEFVRNLQLIENEVEHFDIIASRMPLDIQELKRTKAPVADNDKGMLLGIAEGVNSIRL